MDRFGRCRQLGALSKRGLTSELAVKKLLDIEAGVLALRMPEGTYDDFRTASAIVSKTLEGIERLPVIPREAEDILTVSATERHRWLSLTRRRLGRS